MEIKYKFSRKKIPKENASYKWLSLTMVDSVIKANKKILSSNISRTV